MTLISQLQAVSKYNIPVFARAPWNDFVAIKRILDAGVYGVLVPYVNTKEEALNAVKACKYPQEGIRGVAPSPRAGGFGMNGMNYMEHANKETMVMIAIETPEAVSNLDEILTVEGLDGIFIGPMDLATSMGYFCNAKADEVQKTISGIEEKVLKSDKFLGTVAGNVEVAKPLYDRGYSYIAVMSDTTTLGAIALKTVKEFRDIYGKNE